MLTADLVHARKRKGELLLVKADGEARARALELADSILALTKAHVGRTREELDDALDRIVVPASERRVSDGLKKLADDACTFEAATELDPEELRRETFVRAASERRTQTLENPFVREAVLDAVAKARGVDVDTIERSLFSDLRAAHVLRAAPSWTASMLVEQWELGQAQAVLLRAVRVTVDVHCASSPSYRALFRKLKFLRLLHVITRLDDGYRVEIDGPMSLFDATTKYGLQLSMLLPTLRDCDRFELSADVRWGPTREPLVFRTSGGAATKTRAVTLPPLPDDVASLVTSFRALDAPFRVDTNPAVLDLPGIGLCIPDLVFIHEISGDRVYLEVMGYWSRDAVWKRVELVEAGLPHTILFAVSERLRVSEEVLGDELPGALYVYKGKISARTVLERIERLTAGRSAPARSSR